MKNLCQILVIAVLVIASHGKVASAATHTLSGAIDPLQATTNPGNVGSGLGTISGDYDEMTNLLNYSLEWTGLATSVTNIHFHLGAPGVAGGVELGVPGPWASPQIGTSIALDATQEMNLLDGNWYLNIHTGDFVGGEIRGQVMVTPVPEPGTASLFAGGFLALLSFARRLR
jgi:hypothetical protein